MKILLPVVLAFSLLIVGMLLFFQNDSSSGDELPNKKKKPDLSIDVSYSISSVPSPRPSEEWILNVGFLAINTYDDVGYVTAETLLFHDSSGTPLAEGAVNLRIEVDTRNVTTENIYVPMQIYEREKLLSAISERWQGEGNPNAYSFELITLHEYPQGSQERKGIRIRNGYEAP